MDAPAVPTDAALASFASDRRREPFRFTGSGAEYFRIWIVNLLLTIATLGIYSAWAKVRKLRYFYGNTVVAGSSFEYHGQPRQILRGRLIAAAVLIPYLLVASFFPPWDALFVLAFFIATPFIVVRSRLFTTRVTSWRGIRFDFGGTYGRAARVYVGLAVLTGLTLGLLAPYWVWARQRFVIGATRFGTTSFDFRGRAGDYYTAIMVGGLIMAGGLYLAIFALAPLMDDLGRGAAAAASGFDLRSLVLIPVFGLAYLFGLAFMNARMTNAGVGETLVGEHKLDCQLKVLPLFWIYASNAVAALATLGLLIPWAKVRLMRYQLDNMAVHVAGNLDEFVGAQQSRVAASGEELGDLLGVDIGL